MWHLQSEWQGHTEKQEDYCNASPSGSCAFIVFYEPPQWQPKTTRPQTRGDIHHKHPSPGPWNSSSGITINTDAVSEAPPLSGTRYSFSELEKIWWLCFWDLPDVFVTFLSPLAPERCPSKHIVHKGSYPYQSRSFKWLGTLQDTATVSIMPCWGMTPHPQVPGTGMWFYSVVKVFSQNVF